MNMEGIYRQDTTSGHIIQTIERQIQHEGKYSLRLPEQLTPGNEVPVFYSLTHLATDPINTMDIVLYSANLGLLRFSKTHIQDEQHITYHTYTNEKQNIELVIAENNSSHIAYIYTVNIQ